MRQSFFISDLHLGHPNILLYSQKERPFASPELLSKLGEGKGVGEEFKKELNDTLATHNEWVIDSINAKVGKHDTLYILGDVAFKSEEDLNYVTKIRCRNKKLILGNHDVYSMDKYLSVGFTEIFGMARHKEFTLTHAPVHPQQLESRYAANIHGHLHTMDIDDYRYINVNVDRVGGMPISLQEIRDRIKYFKQQSEEINK